TLIPVVRERKLRLLHQVIVGLIDVGGSAIRITKGQVHAWRIRWRGSSRDRERRHVIRSERVAVWTTVIRILIVDLILQNRGRALLAGQEVYVRRDDVNLGSAGNCRVVVKSGRGTVDVVPLSNYIDVFREVDCDTRITRCIDAVVARIAA